MSSYSSYRNVTRCFTRKSNTFYFIENPSTVTLFNNMKNKTLLLKQYNTHVLNGWLNCLMPRGPFLETPGNFSDPKENFKVKTCWIVAQSVAHKLVNFSLLTDSFIVLFSKLLKHTSIVNATDGEHNTAFRSRNVRETGPRAHLFERRLALTLG